MSGLLLVGIVAAAFSAMTTLMVADIGWVGAATVWAAILTLAAVIFSVSVLFVWATS